MDIDMVLAGLRELRENGELDFREIIVERRLPPVMFRGDPADWELEAELEHYERIIADPHEVDLEGVLLRRDELQREIQRRRGLHYRRTTAPFDLGKVVRRVRTIDIFAVVSARSPRVAHSSKREGAHVIRSLCPFHEERTPSFVMWPEIGGYRCFGCQEHGDCITAVMQLDGLSFSQAVLTLAKEFGVEIPRSPNRLPNMDIPKENQP